MPRIIEVPDDAVCLIVNAKIANKSIHTGVVADSIDVSYLADVIYDSLAIHLSEIEHEEDEKEEPTVTVGFAESYPSPEDD